jgi:hypothetical protein
MNDNNVFNVTPVNPINNTSGNSTLTLLGILLGLIVTIFAIINGGYDLYAKFISDPKHKEELLLSLLDKDPIISRVVVIIPRDNEGARVEIEFKLFETGDIVIRSGKKRDYIAYERIFSNISFPFSVSLANAEMLTEKEISGKNYNMETQKYIESSERVGEYVEETKLFEDGTKETSKIEIKTNKIVETKKENVSLTDDEKEKISNSTYTKDVFKEVE